VQLVDAVRLSDVATLEKLVADGKSMNACNVHSESILHMAARRSSFETVKFILDNGGDLGIVDDYGRTPLHDACWRNNIRFDVITLLLNCNLDLLRTADIRGACPLSYVREEFWMHWCAYFYHQKEKYWNFEIDVEGGGPKPAPFDPSCCELMGLGTGSKSTAIAAAAAAAAAGAAMKDVTNLDLGLNLDDSSVSVVVAGDGSNNSTSDEKEGVSSTRTRRKTHKASAAASILASA
jgi:ankyrin repeat protein